MASNKRPTDEQWMRLAVREGRRGIGRTSPNPAVGAVIVSARGRLLARGWHRGAGLPHAEIAAIGNLARPALARGASIYVTLEPCSTHGRTPPCVDAIITGGFKRVIVGAADPNPAHAGRAFAKLRAAGIEVVENVLAAEAAALNPAFNKWIVAGLPLVIAKCALSLDGRLARLPAEGQWLTGPRARADSHRLRAQVDAILIGAGTLRADNPRLTVRGVRGARSARQPWRVVLTRSGELLADAHIFTDEYRDQTLVFKNRSLRAVLRELGRRQITSVLIEGGGEILAQAFRQRLVDRVHFYIAPLFTGGPKILEAISAPIENSKLRRLGPDLLLTGDLGKV